MAAWRSVRVSVRLFCASAVLAAGLILQSGIAAAAPDALIVVDAKSGKTLYSSNADGKRHPASLTKMMTLYLLFEALHEGRTDLADRITVSDYAAAQQPSKLDVPAGETISVRDAILALVTRSANDIAVAVAEHLAGSERAFAEQMTDTALELGMKATTFRNASGLPHSAQVTTARDMATLGRALREHYPKYFAFFSTSSFVWEGERIRNHNPLLGDVAGVDGIKTGYTRTSGYNLVTSVKRDNREIVAVVIGGETARWRDRRMESLVATYLPKASSGARTAALIPGGPLAAGTLADPPLPRPRPLDEDPAETPPQTIAALVAADAGEGSEFGQGDVTVKGEPLPPAGAAGWRIQIAAAPTRARAQDILEQAVSAAQAILGSATPYTEEVSVRGSTLYRARFGGFASQQAAKDACAYLVKRNFACLPINS
jgi:D-alanyl-D-alanine carboxypeptidase